MLSVDSLSVRYGPVHAVRGLSLHIERGEIVALLGANGAGKSSTLRALMGLTPREQGEIVFDGMNISGWPPEEIVRLGMTLSPEGRQVFSSLTIEENVLLGGFAKRRDRQFIERKITELRTLFPILFDRWVQSADTLSGGEQQQLAIARALMSDPKFLLLDEPSLGLAPLVVERIFQLVCELRSRGLTILLVEQNVEQTLEIADRGYVLANGKIALSGKAQELLATQGVERAYLGRRK